MYYKTMNMRNIIDLFYDEASNLRDDDKMLEAFSLEEVGSMINNLFHGRTIQDWLPQVYSIFKDNLRLDSLEAEQRTGYELGIEYLKLIGDEFSITLD